MDHPGTGRRHETRSSVVPWPSRHDLHGVTNPTHDQSTLLTPPMRSRREFVRSMGASIAAAAAAAESLAAQVTSAQRRSGSERLLVDNPLASDASAGRRRSTSTRVVQGAVEEAPRSSARTWCRRGAPAERHEPRLLHRLLSRKRRAHDMGAPPGERDGHGLLVLPRDRPRPHYLVVVHGERLLLLLSARRGRLPESRTARARQARRSLGVGARQARGARAWATDDRARPRARPVRAANVEPSAAVGAGYRYIGRVPRDADDQDARGDRAHAARVPLLRPRPRLRA